MHRRFRSLALTLGLLGLLVFAPAASAAHRKAAPMPKLVKGTLLSLGDSYSVGWQELPGATQGSTRNGPADQLVPLAGARGWNLKLVNLGCGGATTTSMLTASAAGVIRTHSPREQPTTPPRVRRRRRSTSSRVTPTRSRSSRSQSAATTSMAARPSPIPRAASRRVCLRPSRT